MPKIRRSVGALTCPDLLSIDLSLWRREPRRRRRGPRRSSLGVRGLAADVEHHAELSWDSVEWREMHVEGIKARPDRAAASTPWKQADVDQAQHSRGAAQGGRNRGLLQS